MDQIGTWTKDIWGIYRNGIYHITKTIISRIIGSNMETVGITAKSLLFSSIFFFTISVFVGYNLHLSRN